MKIKVGRGGRWMLPADGMRRDAEVVLAVREAVGPEVDLMVDINLGWDVNRAIRVGRMMQEYDLYWLEDPVHFEDYDGLSRIADALDTPIAAGEYLYGMLPFGHMLKRGSIDIAMIDGSAVSGLPSQSTGSNSPKVSPCSMLFSRPSLAS